MTDIGPDQWWVRAACKGADPEIFYPKKGASLKPARSLCQRCPVSTPCLNDALERNDPFGVWAGTVRRERERLQASRRYAEAS
jgi:WhiB family redox-sensing transcriptional regulator